MRDQATETEIAAYRRDGFVVIDGLLDAEELEEWRSALDEAIAERGDVVIPGFEPAPGSAEATYYSKVFTQRVNLWQTNARLRRHVLDERLGHLASMLAGVEGVRLYHDQALIKEPWGNPTAFHLDVPYWSFSSNDALSVWVALDDATIQNGALLFVPGTHLDGRVDGVDIGPELGDLFAVVPEWGDRMPVACPIPAGSCTFHNGLTAHGAGANMTPHRRRAMTAGFMPLGSTFNGKTSIYPPDDLARMAVGDVLDDDRQNPVVYRNETGSAG